MKESPLKIELSLSYKKAVSNYEVYKLSKNEVVHFLGVIDLIVKELKKIQTTRKHLSQKVQYRNSKNLQRFIIENHTVFFRIDLEKEELQVMYFVASKRIKRKL